MKRFLISALLLLCIAGYGQPVKVVTANSQEWSGGLAGHHGINYNIVIKCADTSITPDTAWMNGHYYPITIDRKDTFHCKIDRRNNTVTYNIVEGESWNDMDPDILKKADSASHVKQPHRNYSGAALVTYWFSGKQYSVLVKSFNQLPALNYP